jgi:group I intron endonuclease
MDYDSYTDSQIGIYKITNKTNGMVYIWQSWNIPKRFREHRNTHDHIRVHKIMTLEGFNNFTFEVIKEIKAHPTLTQIFLDIYEKKFISLYHSNDPEYGYNLTQGGGSGLRSD